MLFPAKINIIFGISTPNYTGISKIFAEKQVVLHSLTFTIVLHNDIICYFSSFLFNSGRFQLTSTLSTTVLPVELMAIKHDCHMFHACTGNLKGDVLLIPGASPMRPTLFKASNNTSVEKLLISYHFKCKGMFQAFTSNIGWPTISR